MRNGTLYSKPDNTSLLVNVISIDAVQYAVIGGIHAMVKRLDIFAKVVNNRGKRGALPRIRNE
jgi:hypothetical protein